MLFYIGVFITHHIHKTVYPASGHIVIITKPSLLNKRRISSIAGSIISNPFPIQINTTSIIFSVKGNQLVRSSRYRCRVQQGS